MGSKEGACSSGVKESCFVFPGRGEHSSSKSEQTGDITRNTGEEPKWRCVSDSTTSRWQLGDAWGFRNRLACM